ncbi:MAG: T9SS type A sorting domain-containing protein [Bacteroidales bacterium]|jgi:hypothetical protein|nr:T9SS type A sorting domain-containing protein [Bacteroidales bacterium]
MKRYILILITGFFTLSAVAQTYKQDVIASAGGYNVNGALSISWTLGETIIPTFQNGDLILTHGFQQQLFITAVEENLETLVKVAIYPNPTSEMVSINFDEALDTEVTFQLINSQGKVVKADIIEATIIETQVNLQDIPEGVYYLKLTKGKLSNVYKVVKL